MEKMLLFDLDETLLTSGKAITGRTADALARARENGYLIGISTSRSESNSRKFLDMVKPDVVISSGGALVSLNGEVIVSDAFSGDEVSRILSEAKRICGDVNISLDSADSDVEFYCNFTPPEDALLQSWGKIVHTDFTGFREPALKLCFEINDVADADSLREALPQCDCIKFSDGNWYKFTRAGVTKENAIGKMCARMGLQPSQITAFGDDLADIGMLQMCGTGVAMGNALDKVKEAADITIGTNDEDGIADYIDGILKKD